MPKQKPKTNQELELEVLDEMQKASDKIYKEERKYPEWELNPEPKKKRGRSRKDQPK